MVKRLGTKDFPWYDRPAGADGNFWWGKLVSSSSITSFADDSQFVLAEVLDQSQDSVLLLDRKGHIEFMNFHARRAMGVDVTLPDRQQVSSIWAESSRGELSEGVAKAVVGQQSRFEMCAPSVDGNSRWWDVRIAPVHDQDKKLAHVLVTMSDVTDYVEGRAKDRHRRKEAEREAHFAGDIADEMRHRLKNQLTVIGSVARLLSRHSGTADELYEKLESKLAALARAQDLLTIHREEPLAALDAITQVVRESGAGDSIEVQSIPDARLSDSAIQHLALILGELQTNSLKYGALRKDRGRIVLSGFLHGSLLGLHWMEDVGERIPAPDGAGSGTMLLERLGSSGGAKASIEWHQTGPSAKFYLRTAT